MQKEVVSKEVMQELINKLEEIVNNYCWNLEYFTDSEVDDFFQANSSEITYYNGLINDNIESKNFLWSSKKIAEELAKSIIEANGYADNLVKNMASIKLKYVTSLPTSNISEHTIYILNVSDGTSKDTLNLYNKTDGWTSIGDFSISLDDYYNKSEIDSKLDKKANADEVISNDKIVQTLDSDTNSADTILSTNGLQIEMDKKANDSEVVKKADITDLENRVTTNEADITDLQEQIDNLDIPEDVDFTDINTRLTQLETKRVYNSIDELNTAKGLSISFTTGEDNTMKIVGALLPLETFADYFHNSTDSNRFGIDTNTYGTEISLLIITKFNDNVTIIRAYMSNGKLLVRRYLNGVLQDWRCDNTTSGGNVGVTTITPVNSAITGTIEYTVKNGICYVSFKNVKSTTDTNNLSISTTMPKSSINCGFSLFSNGRNGNIGFIYIDKNTTKLNGNFWIAGISGSCSFSYPVAES